MTLTWGNVSGIDRERGLVAIKPSGVPYESMTLADIVLVDLDGNVVEGERRPSTDTPTHLELYRAYDWIGGIVHTHSHMGDRVGAGRARDSAARDHARRPQRPADPADAPVDRGREVDEDYEGATGRALVEATTEHDSCALVRGHGPFAWGASPAAAVEAAVTLEQVARLALLTTLLAPDAPPLADAIRRKHFERKHGPHAYYGQ